MKRWLLVCLLVASFAQAQFDMPDLPDVPTVPGIPGMPGAPDDIPLPGPPDEGLPDVPGVGDLPYPVVTPEDLDLDQDAFDQCIEQNPDPDQCIQDLLNDLESQIPGLFPEPEPFPEEEKTAAYVDLIEFHEPQNWGIRIPSIHIGVYEEFEGCRDGGSIIDCDDDFIVTTIYLPISMAEDAQEDIDEAWIKFKEAVADDVHEALNRDKPCVFAPQCWEIPFGKFPVPDFVCAVERTATTLLTSIPEHNATYWQDVITALATHLPNTIIWGGETLPFSVAMSPITDLPQIAQYFETQTDDPREALYELQAVQALGYPDVPLFALPGDKYIDIGGFSPIERGKVEYEAATPYEYQEFGFSTFHEVWPEISWEWYHYGNVLNFKPRIRLFCNIAVVKCYGCVLFLYVPWPFYAPALKGLYEFATVPESQWIPRAEGTPWYRIKY